LKIDIPATVFVHPESVQHGDVAVGDYSSLWPCSVIRGDMGPASVGKFTSIQDNSMVHAGRVGDFVTVAHGAVVHVSTVEDHCMIGIGVIIQDYAVIGEGSIVAAGSVVLEGRNIPPNSIVMGVPAKVKEGARPSLEKITGNALYYAALAQLYKDGGDVTSTGLIAAKLEELRKTAGL
jgi:carbonic anhydrase/acetyltransferase-like protein (isoleucine patch superfamily)